MLSFALMAVAALTIDMGFVLLARRQMQTGVDPAALDGLRFRDAYPPQWIDPSSGQLHASIQSAIQAENASPSTQDDVRRWAAQQMVVNTFDDDLNTADGDTSNYGAGPVVDFQPSPAIPTAGQAIAAAQTMTIDAPSVYKPSDAGSPSNQSQWHFWLNLTNTTSGDVVSGDYTYRASNYNPAQTMAVEDDQYNRVDFQPDSTASASSFLVRLKRSNEQAVSSSFSSGPTLPYLFGQGSLIQTQTTSSGTVWAKSQGITARATGIASARPVMGVGRQSTVNQIQIPGVTSFALRYKFWIQFALTKSSSPPAPGAVLTQPIELDPAANNGSLTAQSQSVGTGLDGQYLSWSSGTFPSLGWLLSTVAVSQPAFSDSINTKNYVPIYDNTFVGDGADWIVGFGVIQVVNSNPLKIQIINGQIAPINAMGYLYGGGLDPAITGPVLTSLISANQGLGAPPTSDTQPIPPVLLAPVLVRSE